MSVLLSITSLSVDYFNGRVPVPAVRDVSFDLKEGKTLGLVGESGCGKSTLALALIGLLPKDESRIPSGRIEFNGKDLTTYSPEQWRRIRGKEIAMVFQDPFSSLNPVMAVEDQLAETGAKKLTKLLEKVELTEPRRILNSYPHQLSGGQRQRVMIALALARNPSLLIADEPTTALDVTVQDDIMKLLLNLKKDLNMSMIFVTHNMGLVKSIADDLAVMYAGQIVEYGSTKDVLGKPKHPYTRGLLKSLPTLTPHKGPIPVLTGQPPEPLHLPSGCPFHPRCEKVFDPCGANDPDERISDKRRVRCHLY